MHLPEDAVLLRIFIGESDRYQHQPLYQAIVLKARELELAGATVLRGPMGFGKSSHLHTAKILRLSMDLPIVIEIVDTEEKVNAFLPVLDEPFSGVDPIAVYDVQQIIVNLRKLGLAIMITDHNVRETLSIVDRAYLIYDGRVESEGTKDFLIDDPISRQLYLGERFKM